MFSPLVQNMIDKYGYPVLAEETLDKFIRDEGEVVLFFTEAMKPLPETDDVAMILPELVKAFNNQLKVAVIEKFTHRNLQLRYGFTSWPTLVFLRDGNYLGAISRVQDWQVYLADIQRILASEPSPPPAYQLPASGEACTS